MGWSSERGGHGLRTALRMGGVSARSLITNLLRHPLMVSTPLAVACIGIGIAAQALLRPGPSGREADLFDALLTQPKATQLAARQPAQQLSSPQPNPADATANLMAQRGPNGGLPEQSPGRALNLEIRVALLKASSDPSLSASEIGRAHV